MKFNLICTTVLVLACRPAMAQGFSQLATNHDGSVLYFSSPLRMKGTDQYLHPKIFTWDSVNGIQLYEQRASDVLFPLPVFGFLGTQFFSLVAPDVSSDGSTVALTGIRFCNISNICVSDVEEYQSTIYRTGQAIVAPGSGSLSRNGRFALLRSSISGLPVPSKIQLLDLQTGQQTQYQGAWLQPGLTHEIADDGTVVLQSFSGGVSLGQNGQLQAIFSDNVVRPMINDAGTMVFFESSAGSSAPQLSVYSVATGLSTALATDIPNMPGFLASITDDGSVIAFLYGPRRQAYVIHSDGTGLRPITDFNEPVAEIELCGDGSVAFAVTASNRIVRIDIASGQSTDIVPVTPYTNVPSANGFLNSFVQGYRFQVNRGAVATITGSGFSANTETPDPPYPLSLDGVELHVNGSAIPIASVSPGAVGYPAPWDLPDAPVDVEVWAASGDASPFVPGFEVAPAPPSTFVTQPPGPFFVIAAHQDFSSLLSPMSPAQPGEIIHVYAKDLGPVAPAPFSGLPAPLSPLSVLVPPISCSLNADAEPNAMDEAGILFAGLAPELLNVFQIDVQLPASFPGNPSRLVCHIGDPAAGYFIAGLFPVPNGLVIIAK